MESFFIFICALGSELSVWLGSFSVVLILSFFTPDSVGKHFLIRNLALIKPCKFLKFFKILL